MTLFLVGSQSQYTSTSQICKLCNKDVTDSEFDVLTLECCLFSGVFHGCCMNLDDQMISLLYIVKSLGSWCCEDCRIKFKKGRPVKSISKVDISDITFFTSKLSSLSDDVSLIKSTLQSFIGESATHVNPGDDGDSSSCALLKPSNKKPDLSILNHPKSTNVVQSNSRSSNAEPLNSELRSAVLTAMHMPSELRNRTKSIDRRSHIRSTESWRCQGWRTNV